VAELNSAVCESTTNDVGFYTQNNLGIGILNALAAINGGAVIFAGSALGLGA